MREHLTLNDLAFIPGDLEEIPVGAGRNKDWNMEEIDSASRQNRERGEQLIAEFEERTKDLVVS